MHVQLAKGVTFVGRTLDHQGKTLWEILGNLKDFGVGRIVVRSTYMKYPEVCYFRIAKVEATPPHTQFQNRGVNVWVDEVYRGVKREKLTDLSRQAFKWDFRLIPKYEEHKLTSVPLTSESDARSEHILPRHMDLPPTLAWLATKNTGKSTESAPKVEVIYDWETIEKKKIFCRLANEDEKPSFEFASLMGLGKPVASSLYEISPSDGSVKENVTENVNENN